MRESVRDALLPYRDSWQTEHMAKPHKAPLGPVEANWKAHARLRAELADLETGELVYGRRRRGHAWEDLTRERIAQVKSELIALNIEMTLWAKAQKDRA